MSLKLNSKYLGSFVSEDALLAIEPEVKKAHSLLNENKAEAAGNKFHGWLTLPIDYDKAEFERIKKAAKEIRDNYEVLVVVGIGGSYLGARCAIEALNGLFAKNKVEIIYMGNTLSSNYIYQVLEYLKDKKFAINVISKSGTTTEPAIAFRLFKELLVRKYGLENVKVKGDSIFIGKLLLSSKTLYALALTASK